MTKKELCEMCNEYSADIKCDNEKACKLLLLLKENKSLKKEKAELKKQMAILEHRMSYMIDQNTIGNRCEMGC